MSEYCHGQMGRKGQRGSWRGREKQKSHFADFTVSPQASLELPGSLIVI